MCGCVVIPAKAGIHLVPTSSALSSHSEIDNMDSRFRGNDESGNAFAGMTELSVLFGNEDTDISNARSNAIFG